MPIKTGTRRILIGASAAVTGVLLGGLVFVFFFMHSVYEPDQFVNPEFVPAAVRASFEQRFPDAADVIWKLDPDGYEAAFHWQGQDEVEAQFDPDGAWSRTEFRIAFSDLPQKAEDYLKAQGEYEVAAVIRVETRNSPVAYEAELGNKVIKWDCQFDREGELLSRTRDGPILE